MRLFTVILCISVLGLAAFSKAWAQTAQTIQVSQGPSYANDVFYRLATQDTVVVARANWDVSLMLASSSALDVNSASGVEAYVLSTDSSDWATVDTAGKLGETNRLLADPTTWASGAINQSADFSNWADLGWGLYDLNTHVISGTRIFGIKALDGNWYKFFVQRRASGRYTLRFARLDGTGQQTLEIVTADFPNRNFVYLNLATGTVQSREPHRNEWDMLFTRYFDYTNSVLYSVTGVLTNAGVRVAQLDGISDVTELRDTTGAPFTEDRNEIGYDWKSFTGGQFVLANNRVYLVIDRAGTPWQVVFTAFGGSATGLNGFTQTPLTPSSIGQGFDQLGQVVLYPNPAREILNVALDLNHPLPGAKFTLLDLQGRIVVTQELAAPAGLNVTTIQLPDHLGAGLYTVRLDVGGQSTSQRVMIQR